MNSMTLSTIFDSRACGRFHQLQNRDFPFPVYLFPWWLAMLAEGDVLQIGALEPNILEAVLTYPDHRLFAILLTI